MKRFGQEAKPDAAPGMLWLSRETGQEVLTPDGRIIGSVVDLSVDLDGPLGQRIVERLLIRRRRLPDLLVPWAALDDFGHSTVRLDAADPAIFAITSIADALHGEEILLKRDVLDTQIVDTAGRRLARVADVGLARTSCDQLELVGVEVGFGGVLRRLGLTRLATQFEEDVVDWADLHLTSERGHTVQLATPRSAVHHLDATGLAALVQRLDTESATEVLAAAEPRVAAGVIREAAPTEGERLLRALPQDDAEQIVSAMPGEHAARWRVRLSHTPLLRGRRFMRSSGFIRSRTRP